MQGEKIYIISNNYHKSKILMFFFDHINIHDKQIDTKI